QVQVTELSIPEAAKASILRQKDSILAAANALHPAMSARGGGAKDVEVRLIRVGAETHAIVHLIVDTPDAMGSNLINTMCEGGAHALCARNGRYEPLTRWWIEEGALHGTIELPIQVGTVGGAVKANPLIPVLLRMMGNPGAQTLAGVMAAVGLAQNMAALRALGTVGIQKGHMALHARNLAVSAGAKGSAVEEVARALIAAGEIKL